jgi:acyl-CoA thioester hydrolase
MDPIYQFELQVGDEVMDGNRHVNNVAYVQWMQDAAIRHATATGCTGTTTALGATWMARSHRVEYFRPAFAGEMITVLTWVSDIRRVRSLRKYRFLRKADQTVLAEGETDWVFVDATTGRPRAIPDDIRDALPIVGKEEEP